MRLELMHIERLLALGKPKKPYKFSTYLLLNYNSIDKVVAFFKSSIFQRVWV